MTTKTLPSQPRKASTVSRWDRETDVVVIGMGAAGASAAIGARTHGAEVLILEAASGAGGTTAMAGGLIYMGGGTPTQQACGFEDDTEEMYKYLMMASGPNADEAKVRLYADGSLEHYQWLIDHGMEFKPEYYASKSTNTPRDEGLIYSGNETCYPFDEHSKAAPRGHKGKVHGEGGGKMVIDKLSEKAIALGVEVEYDARALTAIINDDNEVVGIVSRIDGQERCIKANKGVVLCAGGFIMNPEMVAKYAPRLSLGNIPNGNPNDTGIGIRIGMGVGGSAINMSEGFICLPFYPPASLVEGIMVNGKGQRFINEDCYHGRMGEAILSNPEDKHYLIIDSKNFAALDRPPMGGFKVAEVGETIAELERDLGLTEDTLVNTLEVFNKHAKDGQDPLFHKRTPYLKPLDEPPYAAFDVSLNGGAYFPVFTLGGLNTLPTGEVLSEDDQIIKGLYAAGRNACGLPRCGATYSSGMSIGDATFFGKLAGKSAAQIEQ